MLSEILITFITPLLPTVILGIVGYIVFKTEQQSKLVAVDNKFRIIEKDINKNDERIRQEIKEQNERDDKRYDKIDRDIDDLKINMNRTMNNVNETKIMLSHFEKTMSGMSDKIDLLLKTTMEREVIIERRKDLHSMTRTDE